MKHAREDYGRIQDPAGLIPEDEPVFVIRGQDLVAPAVLRFYADQAEAIGASAELVARVRGHAETMEKWQRDVARKVPDLHVSV